MQHISNQEDDEKIISSTTNGVNIHTDRGKYQLPEADRQDAPSTLRSPQTEPPTNETVPRPINEPPSTQLQTNLKSEEIDYQKFIAPSTKQIAPSSTINMKSHNPDPRVPTINTSQNGISSISTKSTLNASARVFMPKGYSNKASSKCKVMETIIEKKQSQYPNSYNLEKSYKRSMEHKDLPTKWKNLVIVPFEFTQKCIPDCILEEIHDIYGYMDKAMAFPNNKMVFQNMKGNVIVIINFNFHSKLNYGIELFCVMKQDTSGKRKWRMMNKLWKELHLREYYGIQDRLPSSHAFFSSEYQIPESVFQNAFDLTKWSQTPIYRKRRNTQRRVLHITNEKFLNILKQKNINHNSIIPIIAINDNIVSAEYVMIMSLAEDTSIGISYKLESSTNIIKITGIYLDKNELLTYHQLASPQHKSHCLDQFISNIDDLKIGNLKNEQNQIKALKKANKKLQDANKEANKNPIIKYVKETLKEANDLIANNTKTALLSIKNIFNYDTIKQAIKNRLKSKQNHPSHSQASPMISSNIITSNVTDRQMQYLAASQGNVATTIPLPQSAIT